MSRVGAAGAAVLGLALTATNGAPEPGETITFSRHVAPILFANCAPCHRPAGAGPFSLLTYPEARKRARQIAQVTRRRYMPPWLPQPGYGVFAGERRLSEDQIARIEEWVRSGAPEGDPTDLPPPPRWPEGWQLGPPDLVVKLAEPYTVPASGTDIYRNFAISVDVPSTRWVRAVEFRPFGTRAVHHARMLVDRTGTARRLDVEDPGPGFEGMLPGPAENPDGVLVSWTPGKVPFAGRDGMAWRLGRGTDLVLQLHLVPSGKPEPVEPALGLYFADKPPTLHPFSFVLGSRDIDISAGEEAYVVEDSYTLPVDVEALAVYPHAHYLGKDLRASAVLPDGTTRELIWIRDWDFNWQDEYRYASPLPLPRKTTIAMRYTYDNSAGNARNPHDPPRRVVYGSRTSDEMAELMLQVLPRSEADLAVLRQDFERHGIDKAIAYRKRRVEANPLDAESHGALGSSYLALGRAGDAIRHLEAALRLHPGDAKLLNNLGYALQLEGQLEQAIRRYRQALEAHPELVEARLNLSAALRGAGRVDGALEVLREGLRLAPELPRLMSEIAWLLATHPDPSARRPEEAIRLASRAAELAPGEEPAVLATLAAAYAAAGRFHQAVETAEAALRAASATPSAEIAGEIQRQLELYRSGKPYREGR
jgi:tetratricopeptide (TPR) repeat protein/mono/diheme cytochrome c family protein